MSLELEKSMRIVNDLVSFCYYEGAEEFDIYLKHNRDESTEMRVSCNISGVKPDRLEEIRQALGTSRQHEVEQSYWELSGEPEFSEELSLAGAMSDRAVVNYENGKLSITVYRDD